MNMIKRSGVCRSIWITVAALLGSVSWSNAGLINHWKFDETNGVAVAIDSIGSLPVTLNGNTAFVTDATRGQVLDLGGTANDYAMNTEEPFLTSMDHTVAVWVNHHDTGSFSGIWLSWGTLGVGRYFLGPSTYNNGKILMGLALKTQFFSDGGAIPTQNTWQHWAIVRDGSALRLYRDGELVQAVTLSTGATIGTYSGLQIGRAYDETAPLDGRMDDLAIWDEPLTQAQIQKAMNDGAENYGAPLRINHWKFDESSGLTGEDSVGSLPVTLVNGAAFATDTTRGQVLELAGDNDYATNAGEPFTNDMTHTVGLWAKHDATSPFSAAWLTWGSGGARYYLLPYAPASRAGAVVCTAGSDSMRQFNVVEAVPASGTWQYWTFIRNMETLKVQLYRNGTRIQTMTTANGGLISLDGVLRIGAGLSADLPLDGRMDDVAIWKGALTPAEIQKAMKYGAENFNRPPSLALIHNWKFDELGEPTVSVDSEGNLSATLQNGAAITNDATRGRVLELDGENDYAVNATGVPLTADIDHTVALWVNHHASGTNDIWLAWGSWPPTMRYFLGPHSAGSGKIIYGVGEDSYISFYNANAAPVPNTWQYWTIVREGRQARIYLNGVHVETKMKDNGSAISVGDGLQIGRSYDESSNLDGRMDDLAIWQGALSVEQIQNAMTYGAKYYLGPPQGTLILLW